MTLAAAPRRSDVITRSIADQIRSHELPPDTRLPSERELCEAFGVSRTTVRRAIADLSRHGLVRAEPGRGTYVRAPWIGEVTNNLVSFTELGAARSLLPSARVLHAGSRPATLDEAALFAVAPGSDLFVLIRLRMLDSLPVSVDENLVPAARAAGFTTVDFTTASLYATLAAAGHEPMRADYTIEAAAADEQVATHLEVAVGAPLLQAHTISADAAGATVERGRMLYRADRYRFHATLIRQSDAVMRP